MPDTTPEEPRVRPFADFLREQAGGTSHDELSEALQTLAGAVAETGKAGSLTYQVKVSKLDKNGDALVVADVIKLNAPVNGRPTAIFFADKDNNLVRDNPAQLAFEALREVPGGKVDAAALKEAQAR